MSQTEQCHSCALLWDAQPSNHLCNQRLQTVHASQCRPACDVLWDIIQASSCSVKLKWIHTQTEVEVRCSAQVNSSCLGHDSTLAVLFVGILFYILLHSHDSIASTSSATTAAKQFRKKCLGGIQRLTNPRTPNRMALKLTLRESLRSSWKNRKRVCHIWEGDCLVLHQQCFSIQSVTEQCFEPCPLGRVFSSQHPEQQS